MEIGKMAYRITMVVPVALVVVRGAVIAVVWDAISGIESVEVLAAPVSPVSPIVPEVLVAKSAGSVRTTLLLERVHEFPLIITHPAILVVLGFASEIAAPIRSSAYKRTVQFDA